MDNKREVLNYWQDKQVESMYDKHLLMAEIELIKSQIPEGAKILDAGCGEGEGTYHYSFVKDVKITAVDFSKTRIEKAKKNLEGRNNVKLMEIDFLSEYVLECDFDVIISQRFLINLLDWDFQKKVISDLMKLLKPSGKLLMLEGSKDGAEELNDFRKLIKLPEIPVKWHNLFFEDKRFNDFLKLNRFNKLAEFGLGDYFLLTRGLRPYFDKDLNWNVEFNKIASSKDIAESLGLNTRFSRLKLWVISNKK